MPVVTISRQFGAAGRSVGQELARRMGGEFLDREIVAAVAERAGIPEAEAEGYDEQLPSLWQRVAAAIATSAPDLAMPPLPVDVLPPPAVHEHLAALTRAVIEEAAARGNAVILGRGGVFIVGRRPDALHVQLHASLEARVRTLVSRVEEIPPDRMPPDGRPDEAALRELCQSMDARRAAYIRRLFDADWLDASHYDLSIDTGRLDLGTVVDIIELAVRRLGHRRQDPPRP
jgi:cytidylate kinase